MGKRFEESFSEACKFTCDEWHVSRNAYAQDEAVKIIKRDVGVEIDITELKPCWVRFQFASESVRDEFGVDHCWMVVKEGTKGAQPTWAYSEI
jgi:hypothetical protein